MHTSGHQLGRAGKELTHLLHAISARFQARRHAPLSQLSICESICERKHLADDLVQVEQSLLFSAFRASARIRAITLLAGIRDHTFPLPSPPCLRVR